MFKDGEICIFTTNGTVTKTPQAQHLCPGMMEEDSMALQLFTYLGTQAPLSQQILKDPYLCWHGHTALIDFEE